MDLSYHRMPARDESLHDREHQPGKTRQVLVAVP
jgi:hypothetical protein